MGYSISEETYERIERNRREERLCQGSTRCSTRATRIVTQRCWLYTIEEGPETLEDMKMCTRHANTLPVGFRGVNFIVTQVQPF
jgi:hypothetical protein